MNDISQGELPSADREDLMNLVKRADMIADWSRGSTRILGAIPMKSVPTPIKDTFIVIVKSAKRCARSVRRCVNMTMTKPDEAPQATDAVEREEEKADDIHEKARILIGKEDMPHAGVAVLISQLFDAMEMVTNPCEDVCDQVRVIMVRK